MYIGTTQDIDRRLKEHNSNNRHYTGKNKGGWRLLKSIYFKDKKKARKEEKRLKRSKNKKYILWYFGIKL